MTILGLHAAIPLTPIPPTPAAPSMGNNLQQSLGAYLNELQWGLGAAGPGAAGSGDLASPPALFDAALQRLRGFLRRADAMSRGAGKPEQTGGVAAFAELRTGPAEASLVPVWSPGAQAGPPSASNLLDGVAKEVLDTLSFHLEADLIARTTSQVGRSIQTLVKAQ
jgi:hypothetical protein